MKKQILSIGKALNRAEQKQVFGGETLSEEGWCSDVCQTDAQCPTGQECFTGTCDGDPTKMCRKKAV